MISVKNTFVIIGGATRAGTTSLHKYLSDHKDVCASSQKETRFFLDEDYPSPYPITYQYGRHPMQKYFEYFQDHTRNIFLEATPDYLFSAGTPKKVKESLNDVKWLFILRDPIERLKSWFYFGRQVGELSAEISLEEFISFQLNETANHRKQIFRTLEQGNYSAYLQQYYELFGAENILLLSFGALEREPLKFMKTVCDFIEIDSSDYDNYKFSTLNSSVSLKHVGGIEKYYMTVGTKMFLRVYNRPIIRKLLHFLRASVFEPVYYRLNANKNGQEEIPLALKKQLANYYSGELQRLEKLSGRKFSWE